MTFNRAGLVRACIAVGVLLAALTAEGRASDEFGALLPGEIPGLALAPGDAAATPDPQGDSEPVAISEPLDDRLLAEKLSNPIADMISVPIQFNYDKGFGSKEAGVFRTNIQPVIPISLGDDWNLITRTVIPIINQESRESGQSSRFGLGDIDQSFFFSPRETVHGWIWGVGPSFKWPSATDDVLGAGKYGAGLTGVLLKQDRGWTYGILWNHTWSYAGEEDRNRVCSTFFQPFLAYTFPSATTVALNTESIYNWQADDWSVPINLSVGQLTSLGDQPVQLSVGGRYYAETVEGGPEWGVRCTITFLIPR